ncbi:sporulation protein Cse60 [Planococcus soli]|uniref:sporulation protein Cse60 n=1 Tax=Planococcus soli TaxID=2666072 RepID=UPI00115CD3A1|nr:sporulation protein Cse60 [Planococcus soli]
MRVKTFYGYSEKSIDRKINEFLEDTTLEIIDIKFTAPIFYFSAMVIYKPTVSTKDNVF